MANNPQRGIVPRGLFNFQGRLPTFSLLPSFFEDFDQDIAELANVQSGLTVSEDKKNVYIEASMPGLKSDDIEVTLDQGILLIKGERREEVEDKEKKFYRRAQNSFSYRIALPSHVDTSKEPKANYKDGMMKITFNKMAQSQAKKINVKGG